MAGMLEVAALSIKAEDVVTDVIRILKPTDSMTRPTRSTLSLMWPVLKYAPVIMKVSSRPIPKITKMRRFVKEVIGTPEETHILTLADETRNKARRSRWKGRNRLVQLTTYEH
jgi:hypothetical protein